MTSILHVQTSVVAIRSETASDVPARERLLDAAFGPARLAKTCERFREGRLPAEGLAFSATDGGQLVGTLRFWNVMAGGAPALVLGPLAVAESHRSEGIGRRLIGEGLFRAVCLGHRAVILVGDAPYYGRFGFERRLAANLALPGPVESGRFLALELHPGALANASGLVVPTGRRAPVRAPILAPVLQEAA